MVAKQKPGSTHEELVKKYALQSLDAGTFYRATAHLFWQDFVRGGWGNFDISELGIHTTLADGSPIQRTSTWTWITGDQHLSNFGAYMNRQRNVVFDVNDFDEAIIFDFQMDVWRVAVSICNHALMNGLRDAEALASVLTFTDVYISTVQGYLDNDFAQDRELTAKTSKGELARFLKSKQDNHEQQNKLMAKFTERDPTTQQPRLVKSTLTKLEKISPELEAEIRQQFTAERYGSTLLKVGWHAKQWNDNFFRVVDVARRVDSGVGSFGVGRFYVLLSGTDNDTDNAENGVILDVKFEPPPAGEAVLNKLDRAWYRSTFRHEAMRAVQAQRALTSYTDPYTGWVFIHGAAYAVRQRSPYKASFDLSSLKNYAEFAEYVSYIAAVTATSHTRGTVAHGAGQFKEVISSALGPPYARATWGVAVATVAAKYREQVMMDYECFKDFVQANYTSDNTNPVEVVD